MLHADPHFNCVPFVRDFEYLHVYLKYFEIVRFHSRKERGGGGWGEEEKETFDVLETKVIQILSR